MTKDLWVNLPVKDVSRAKEFFAKIGFTPNDEYADSSEMACVQFGDKNTAVLLFAEDTFKNFAKHELTDTKQSAEILISFGAESREEVDETAKNVWEAGGAIFSEPAEIQGWMYGFAFTDLDGHRWNQLFMDHSKMPQKQLGEIK